MSETYIRKDQTRGISDKTNNIPKKKRRPLILAEGKLVLCRREYKGRLRGCMEGYDSDTGKKVKKAASGRIPVAGKDISVALT